MSEPQNPGPDDPAGGYDPPATPYTQAAPPYAPDRPLGGRPRIADTTPVYTWLIWVLALSPLIGIATSVLYTPSYSYREVNGIRTIDPLSIYTPAYFAVLGVGLAVYVLSIVFAYLDSRELRRRGVDRPFHWAFAFIPVVVPAIYLIGRSIIVHRVASPRGLAPIWVWIASFVVSTVVGLAVAIPRVLDMLQNLPTLSR